MTIAAPEPRPDDSARCLIVEHDDRTRYALVHLFESRGIPCRGAHTGAEALRQVARSRPPDIVVSDVAMPDLDAAALLAQVRECAPDTAVIFTGEAADAAAAIASFRLGADDFVRRPIAPVELHARVALALAQRERRLARRDYQDDLERRLRAQATRIREIFLQGVQMLARALEAKDAYTRGHSVRVSRYAVATARRLGLDEAAVDAIRFGGELHDIGKVGTREAVLHKPGRLTTEEVGQIREHVTLGEQMLAPLAHESPAVLRCVRSHHERMDGHGFPDGLKGEAIPIEARIIAVADAFDAMTTRRPYRAPYAPHDALAELRRVSGSQLDPTVVLAFNDLYPELVAMVPGHQAATAHPAA